MTKLTEQEKEALLIKVVTALKVARDEIYNEGFRVEYYKCYDDILKEAHEKGYDPDSVIAKTI